jgi:hypothetical protein
MKKNFLASVLGVSCVVVGMLGLDFNPAQAATYFQNFKPTNFTRLNVLTSNVWVDSITIDNFSSNSGYNVHVAFMDSYTNRSVFLIDSNVTARTYVSNAVADIITNSAGSLQTNFYMTNVMIAWTVYTTNTNYASAFRTVLDTYVASNSIVTFTNIGYMYYGLVLKTNHVSVSGDVSGGINVTVVYRPVL